MKKLNKPLNLILLAINFALITLAAGAALTSSIQTTVASKHSSSSGLATAFDTVGYTVNKTFGDGSGTTQLADLVYHATGTLTSGGNATIDVAGGIVDAFGSTITMKRVKAILVENTSASMTITLGNATHPVAFLTPGTATITIPPLGVWSWTAPLVGIEVTAAVSDEIKLVNSSGDTCTYKIWIIGGGN